DRALERVAQERQRGQPLAAGTQHVGGADIAGPDGADVASAGEPREQKTEWDRAQKIAERQRAPIIGQDERPADGMKHGNPRRRGGTLTRTRTPCAPPRWCAPRGRSLVPRRTRCSCTST